MFTHSGKRIDLAKNIIEIDFNDIALSLSLITRYCGHLGVHYSVAQHSCLVADLVGIKTNDARMSLAGLLHDAPEAFLSDVPSPVKKLLPDYKRLERMLLTKILAGVNLPGVLPKEVILVDKNLVDWEVFSFKPEWKAHKKEYTKRIVALNAESARRLFVEKFNALTQAVKDS